MRRYISIASILTALVLEPAAAQDNWPQWCDPLANGVGQATDLPATWSATENVVWETPLPSWSGSTPIIWGERIFLTSPSAADPASGEEI